METAPPADPLAKARKIVAMIQGAIIVARATANTRHFQNRIDDLRHPYGACPPLDGLTGPGRSHRKSAAPHAALAVVSLSFRNPPKQKGRPEKAAFDTHCGRSQISLPIATAVSDIRFEKPHSLSYQVRMRHIVPSMTLVWSRWKIELCGSWLKSIETLG